MCIELSRVCNWKISTSTLQGTARGAEAMAAAQTLWSMSVEDSGCGGPQSLLAPVIIPGMILVVAITDMSLSY